MLQTKKNEVVFPITEVVSQNEFFDYNAKYKGEVTEITPARLSPELTSRVQQLTSAIYDILGCKGIVRVDYIITEGEKINMLEINTTLGMTATSFIPQQVQAAGLILRTLWPILLKTISINFVSLERTSHSTSWTYLQNLTTFVRIPPKELPQIFEELLSDKDFQAVIQSVMPNVPGNDCRTIAPLQDQLDVQKAFSTSCCTISCNSTVTVSTWMLLRFPTRTRAIRLFPITGTLYSTGISFSRLAGQRFPYHRRNRHRR